MTGKEIVEMAFNLEKTPRLPVTLIGGGAWYLNWLGKTYGQIKGDPEQLADYTIQAVKRFKHDLVWSGSGLINYPYHVLGAPIKDDTADPAALEGPVIKSNDELDTLDRAKVLNDPMIQGMIRSHHLAADAIGKECLVIPTQWGPFTGAARILGAEALMMETFEAPEETAKLIAFSTEMIWEMVEPMLTHPDVAGVNFSEPVASGDMVSPDTFRSLVAPFLKDLVDRLKAKGKYAMIHICGDTTGILDQVAEIAPHCFSLEAKVDLARAKEVLGGRVCVAGQVSPIGSFLDGTPEEVKTEAQTCIDTWGDDPGFLLTLGCDFPTKVPIENLDALMSFKA
ncbi:MAG: uroporphyrinogen decarboxylase family protein [Deltaproteobacteria bacterium]|nr:uroporphyrinogen decarboxylase family protein [Deltaproteobacteria bacterium]